MPCRAEQKHWAYVCADEWKWEKNRKSFNNDNRFDGEHFLFENESMLDECLCIVWAVFLSSNDDRLR